MAQLHELADELYHHLLDMRGASALLKTEKDAQIAKLCSLTIRAATASIDVAVSEYAPDSYPEALMEQLRLEPLLVQKAGEYRAIR